MIDVWCVHTDEEESDSGPPTHFFSTETVAREFARDRGWDGSTAPISLRTAIRDGGEYYLIDLIGHIDLDGARKKQLAEIRDRLMSIFTDDELEALGLKR